MKNRPFPENPSHTSRPFQHLHSDVKSFPVELWGDKFKYYVSIYDDFSQFVWIILIHSKDKVDESFKQWYKTIEASDLLK